MTTSIARAEAAFQEQIHAQWRDWCAYLRARLDLLDAESSPSAAFEAAEVDDRARVAERVLATLAPAQLRLFDEVREERRQRLLAREEGRASGARARALLPVEVERRALTALLAEAEGTDEGAERDQGAVPLRIDGELHWYTVSVSAMRGAPAPAAYAVMGGVDDVRRRVIIAALLGVAAVLFLVVWFLWPRGSLPAAEVNRAPTSNDAPVAVWPVRAVRVSGPGLQQTISITPTSSLAWPAHAAWRAEALAPLRLCLPADTLAGLSAISLLGPADLPARSYGLSATRGATADLVIDPCAGDSGQARYGVLQATTPAPELATVESADVAGVGTITVQSLTVVGPGEDSSLPPGSARIIVRVESPALDWPAFAPALLLETGQALTSPEQVAIAGGVELRYLAPLPARDLAAVWSIAPPGAGQTIRWRATVPAPPDRVAVLRRALRVTDARVAATGELVALRVTLRNVGDAPLQLGRDDLALTRAGAQLALPDMPELRAPLAPGAELTLSIPLDAQALGGPSVLTIGPHRLAIDP